MFRSIWSIMGGVLALKGCGFLRYPVSSASQFSDSTWGGELHSRIPSVHVCLFR